MSGTAVFKRMVLTLSMAFGAFVAFWVMLFTYLSGYCVAFLVAQVLLVILTLGSPVPLFWRTDAGLKMVGLLWVGAMVLVGVANVSG